MAPIRTGRNDFMEILTGNASEPGLAIFLRRTQLLVEGFQSRNNAVVPEIELVKNNEVPSLPR
jgi:hypothetical protein